MFCVEPSPGVTGLNANFWIAMSPAAPELGRPTEAASGENGVPCPGLP
jgi:hypothetical protein